MRPVTAWRIRSLRDHSVVMLIVFCNFPLSAQRAPHTISIDAGNLHHELVRFEMPELDCRPVPVELPRTEKTPRRIG
jgi:hypothetical protein